MRIRRHYIKAPLTRNGQAIHVALSNMEYRAGGVELQLTYNEAIQLLYSLKRFLAP